MTSLSEQIWAAAFAAEFVRQHAVRVCTNSQECWYVADQARVAFIRELRKQEPK